MQQFGNWRVTTEGIEWTGKANNPDFNEGRFIPLNLLKHAQSGVVYDWPLQVLKKSHSKEDIYAFNTAFIYGMELAGEKFPPGALSETFAYQNKYFEENGEDDSDEITIGGKGKFE